jgi:hypothetical protein
MFLASRSGTRDVAKATAVAALCLVALTSERAWAQAPSPSSTRATTGLVPEAFRRAVEEHLEVTPTTYALLPPVQNEQAVTPNWCKRRAVLCGTAIGFGIGYSVGFLSGENPIYEDLVPSADAVVVGGLGAAVGAVVGAFLSR